MEISQGAVIAAVGVAAVVGLVGVSLWKCYTYLNNRNIPSTKPIIEVESEEVKPKEVKPEELVSRPDQSIFTERLNYRNIGQNPYERTL